MSKNIALFLIVCTTIALCLWPDLHPERMVVNQHYWFMDLITHGGYYFIATSLLLALKLKPGIFITALSFFALSLLLEFLQYFSYKRSVDPVDMAYNLVGITGAALIFGLIRRSRGK